MDKTIQNLQNSENRDYEVSLQRSISAIEANLYMDIGTYEDLFSIITSLTKKYIFQNIDTLPKKYRFERYDFRVEIGKKYRKRQEFEETLFFVPGGFCGSSFISFGFMNDLSEYSLKEIFDDLYPPQQILDDFYKTLMTFAKNNKQQIKGLKIPLQFMKIILENEEENGTWQREYPF